jgi:anthranilate phosphoribosyltransferase
MADTLGPTGGWPALLARLIRRESLTAASAADALGAILEGGVDPIVVAGFAAALATKGETDEELIGFVDALRAHGESVEVNRLVIDTCGTGGDRLGTINVSTTAALIAAGGGVAVCKHGGRAASSVSGSADVLEALGVAIELGPNGVSRCIDEAGMGFCFAPRFHPAMRFVAPVRRALGVSTVFNLLGPLVNPARAKHQVIGVSDPAAAPKLIAVLEAVGSQHAMVVYGHDGLDELSIGGGSTVHELRRAPDGSAIRTVTALDPRALGIPDAGLDAIRGGSPEENAARVRAVLRGETGPQREIALLNAAAAFIVAGAADSFAEGLLLAARSIDSGAAEHALDRLIDVSRAPSTAALD